MPRPVLALSLVLALGCARERPAPGGGAAVPPVGATGPAVGATVPTGPAIARARAWAGAGATVTPAGAPFGDLEVFLVIVPGDPAKKVAPRRLGVAVAPGATEWYLGKIAVKAVVNRGIKAPAELARAAALFLGNGVTVVTSAAGLPESIPAPERALIKPPALQDGVVEYYGTCCPGLPQPHLEVGRLVPDTLVYSAMRVGHRLEVEAARAAAASAPAPAPGKALPALGKAPPAAPPAPGKAPAK